MHRCVEQHTKTLENFDVKTIQKVKNLLFCAEHRWIGDENGTQSLSFQKMKYVDWWGEHHIKK